MYRRQRYTSLPDRYVAPAICTASLTDMKQGRYVAPQPVICSALGAISAVCHARTLSSLQRPLPNADGAYQKHIAMCRVALDGGKGGDSSGGSEEEIRSDGHRRGGGSPVPVDEQEVRCSRAAPRSPPLTPAPCTAAGLHQLTTRTMYVRSGVGLIG